MASPFVANISLAPFAFAPIPLGSVSPLGWVSDQMGLMSDGLAGHEYDFYHIVQHSPWLGGRSEYSDLNEGLPYWFNGLVPLAYGTSDTRLQNQVLTASEYIISHQQDDGWLGPEPVGQRDLWGRFSLLLGLMQLSEAVQSETVKIIPAMYKFVTLMHSMLVSGSGLDRIWGRARYADMLIILEWLHEKHPTDQQSVLIDTMFWLKQRSFDWPGYWTEQSFLFANLDTVQPPITGDSFSYAFSHGVNVGQALKTGAAVFRLTGNSSLLQAQRDGVKWTLAFHGNLAGSITGDERESGLDPNRGAELCTTVETMYSLSYLYQTLGDNTFADQCELAAFNALPGSITADHWAHEYITVPNAPFAMALPDQTPWYNVGKQGNLYSLEPNYPCCTVNMPQGLPKYLSASFVQVGPNGTGHSLMGPAQVSTRTASGTNVTIVCDTNYPFDFTLRYNISASAAFDFSMRVPSWSILTASSVKINKQASQPLNPDARTGMTTFSLPQGKSCMTFTLSASIRTKSVSDSSVAVYVGPLHYALDVGQSVATANPTLFDPKNSYPSSDGAPNLPPQVHDVTFTNTKPWNIAIDPSTLVFHSTASNGSASALPNPIFDYEAPPTFVTAKGCEIDWPLDKGIPKVLSKDDKVSCKGPPITNVLLRPYGSLKIHMSALPVVDLRS